MSCGKNYYQILQISRKADAGEIKKAYRAQAKLWHPDINPPQKRATCEDMMKSINIAYQILGNPDKRTLYNLDHPTYDFVGKTQKPPKQPQKSPPPPPRGTKLGEDIYQSLTISWVEAINGGERKIYVTRNESCSACHGSGCSSCSSSGFIKSSRNILVTIPKGIASGKRIKLKGAGHFGIRGGTKGDLFVDITVSLNEKVPFGGINSQKKSSCRIYIISQSKAMAVPLHKSHPRTRADALADIINRNIRELVLKNYEDKIAPDDVFVSLIGYSGGSQTGLLQKTTNNYIANIQQLASSPIRIENRQRKVKSKDGRLIDESIEFPIWIESKNEGDESMNEALVKATDIARKWCENHPDDNPPTILIISAEKPADNDLANNLEKLKSIGNNSGRVFIMNVIFSDKKRGEIVFADSAGILPTNTARSLFNISSPVSEKICYLFKNKGYHVSTDSRAFVYNATTETLILCLQVI